MVSGEQRAMEPEEAEMERLLRENENRGKTPEQQIREGMTWEPIEDAKARGRKGYELSSGKFSGTESVLNNNEAGEVRNSSIALCSPDTIATWLVRSVHSCITWSLQWALRFSPECFTALFQFLTCL
jgi:hypothetical protein